MGKVLVNGIELCYHQFGEGPDLVMVHGITGNQAIWHLQIVPALVSSFRVTTYDLRGHGYSDVPPTGYTTADHASDLNQLLTALGIEQAHLMGHSFGADIALHFSLDHPEKINRLILVEPAIAALTFLREHEGWVGWLYWREKLALGGVTVPEERWYDPEYLVRASVQIPMLFGFRQGRARRAAPLIRLMDTTSAARDYTLLSGMTLDRIDQMRLSTLVLYGEESVFIGTFEYLRDHLPHARCYLMSDSEHFGPIERPDMLLAYLRSFLNEAPTHQPAVSEPAQEEQHVA